MEMTHPTTHEEDLDSPFTPYILAALLLLLLNYPHIPPCNGWVDPKAHIHLFMDAMIAQDIQDAHMCRLFPATLKSTASPWFHSLLANSIGNFRTLCWHFLAQFEGSIWL